MYGKIRADLRKQILALQQEGLFKKERILTGPQSVEIAVQGGGTVINFCANNYLGLANHPKVIDSAHNALDEWGYGMSSVRFICGTQAVHKALELRMSQFLGTEDTILYAACFDANGGVFEPFMDSSSAIISDALNHASLIDGVRLTKARRFIYEHGNMEDLEAKLKEAADAKYRIIATDGVFSMDGDIADLEAICDLADAHDALVLVDDSHATGVLGRNGRGTPEYCGVESRVDLITTTFGKALGGASGGCVSGRQAMIDWLRQKSRPYLFSNTLPPVVAGTTLAVLNMLSDTTVLRDRLEENTRYFRDEMTQAGFDIRPGNHPIVPIMLYVETLAHNMAEALLNKGIYVIGFSHPVVPKGQARIRVQISAAHEKKHLDRAIGAFVQIGRQLNVIE